MSNSDAPSLQAPEGADKSETVDAAAELKKRRQSARVEMARASFKRQTSSLSTDLANAAASPARYRVASGRAEFGADGAAFRTDDNRLSGWVLVQKAQDHGKQRMLWRRRYVEVDRGVMSLYKTEPPTNFHVGKLADLEVRVQCGPRWTLELWSGGRLCEQLSSPTAAKIRKVADEVMGRRAGQTGSHNYMTTVDGSGGRSLLLSWDGETLSLFEKRPKSALKLFRLQVETSEIKQVLKRGAAQYQMSVRNGAGEEVVMTVPDSLLLLQWCGAITSSDDEPLPKKNKDQDAGDAALTENVFRSVVVQSARAEPHRRRTMSLGLSQSLGLVHEEEGVIPKKDDIKQAMVTFEGLPDLREKSMRDMLADPVMKKFVFQWSKTQFCSESVKFLTACENLNARTSVEDRANGLRKICEDYISSSGIDSVNIGGLSRKKIMSQVKANEEDDAALSALLPGILENPMQETIRVLEFDLHPQFSLLLSEVFELRAAMAASPPRVGDPTSPTEGSPRGEDQAELAALQKMKGTRDMYMNESLVQQLLIFCSSKQEKDTVHFVSLVAQFKESDDLSRKNMAQNIYSQFLDSNSSSFLDHTDEDKRRKTMMDLQEKLLCPPISLFDGPLTDAFSFVDHSGLFKRFQKSKQPEKKKKKKIFGSMAKKQGKAMSLSLNQERRRLSRTSPRNSSAEKIAPEKSKDEKLIC